MTRFSSLILPGLIHLGSIAVVGSAWAYQFAGLLPCILCLQQRVPHYALLAFLVPTLLLFRFALYRKVFYVVASLDHGHGGVSRWEAYRRRIWLVDGADVLRWIGGKDDVT